MSFKNGNKSTGKHYWLTPPKLMEELQGEFKFNYDPCPHPKPEDLDGLKAEWGESNYVNPPFGSYIDVDGKRKGPTAWARKAIAEFEKGKRVVLVYPIDKWIHMMLAAGAEIRNLKDVKWCATEDGSEGPGTGRWIAMFILEPEGFVLPDESVQLSPYGVDDTGRIPVQRSLFQDIELEELEKE